MFKKLFVNVLSKVFKVIMFVNVEFRDCRFLCLRPAFCLQKVLSSIVMAGILHLMKLIYKKNEITLKSEI